MSNRVLRNRIKETRNQRVEHRYRNGSLSAKEKIVYVPKKSDIIGPSETKTITGGQCNHVN